jgi:tetratricopeptide (TPR) repeat protein
MGQEMYRWLLVIFLVALCYRFVYYLEVMDNPMFLYPVIDAAQHHAWAQKIALGQVLGSGPDDVFKPWFYPLFLGGIYAVFGPSLIIVQWLQFVVGSVSAVLIALLGSSLFGKKTGLLAGFISALYAPFLFFEGQLLTPAISIFLNLILALLLIRGNPPWGTTGLLAGIAAGFRPDVLISFGLGNGARFVSWARQQTRRRVLIKAALLLSGFMAVCLPIIARNHALVGQWIVFSSNAGINFYTGNRPGADGLSAIPPGLAWEKTLATVPKDILSDPAAASRLWFSRTIESIIKSPGTWLTLLFKKAFAFLNGLEFRNNIGYNWFRQNVQFLQFPFIQFWPISALSLLGIVLFFRQRKQSSEQILPVVWIAGYFIVGMIFFVTARFRLPAVPFMIILAAYALNWFFQKTHHTCKKMIGPILLLGVFLCLTWPGWFPPTKGSNSQDYINLGNVLRNNKRQSQAIAAYDKANDLNPTSAEGWFMSGTTHLHSSHIDQAIRYLTRARELDPTGVDILLNLGNAYFQKRDIQQAKELYQATLDLMTDRNLSHKRDSLAKAHLGLWRIHRMLGQKKSAAKHMEQAWIQDELVTAEYCLINSLQLERCAAVFQNSVRHEPWNWYPRANLGMTYLKLERFHQAALELKKCLQRQGALPGVQFYLGVALIRAGETTEGKKVLNTLNSKLPPSGLKDKVQSFLATLE